jgi:hypothetical protein
MFPHGKIIFGIAIAAGLNLLECHLQNPADVALSKTCYQDALLSTVITLRLVISAQFIWS